jgi:hypothetical protein
VELGKQMKRIVLQQTRNVFSGRQHSLLMTSVSDRLAVDLLCPHSAVPLQIEVQV